MTTVNVTLSTTDGAANKTAIDNALLVTGVSIVQLPAGDYPISGTVAVQRSDPNTLGVTIRGAGAKLTRLIATGSFSTPIFDLGVGGTPGPNIGATRQNRLNIEAIGFTSDGIGIRDQYAIRMNNIGNATIRDVSFDRIGAVYFFEVACVYFQNFWIFDTSTNAAYPAIVQDGGNDLYISTGIIKTSKKGSNTGFLIRASGATWMRDVDIMEYQYGMIIDAQPGRQMDWCFFESCAFDTGKDTSSGNTDTIGVLIRNSGAPNCQGMTFSNCWFSSMHVGVRIYNVGADKTIDGMTFDHCRFLSNKKEGLVVDDNSGNIRNIEIRNSQFGGNSDGNNGQYSGMRIGAGTAGVRVIGNTSGKYGSGPTGVQKYGLEVTGTIPRLIMTGNDFEGNTFSSGGLGAKLPGDAFGPNFKVADNIQYNSEVLGYITLQAGSANQSFPHYLADIPSVNTFGKALVNLEPWTPLESVGVTRIAVTGLDQTNFVVHTDAAPAGSVILAYRARRC
jgi:hypothetical protein